MKKTLILTLLFCICYLFIQAQIIYVDSNTGNDQSPGTKEAPLYSIQKAAEIIKNADNDFLKVRINPGIYVLDHVISISADKNISDKRIVFEASILPNDTAWTPEKMPVIISQADKGEIAEYYNFVASFLVDVSNVTIRGLKFNGYSYPNTRFFPIARFNKQATDLLVQQCMFVGDKDASHIQVGIIADGNKINVDHCVFYNAKNAVVFWRDAGDTVKTGNSFTNNIVYGAFQTAVWMAWPDRDFECKNNIIANCKHFIIKNEFNNTVYFIENSVIVNNQFYQGVADNTGVHQQSFQMNEAGVVKDGEITLVMIADNVDEPLPVNYLHVVPETPGCELEAGLFKRK